jgi:23S rRNA pseudouridine1911/1915/1917 synthase
MAVVQEYSLVVPAEAEGRRLDVVLAEFALERKLGLSRTSLQHLIQTGAVSVNRAVAARPHQRLRAGDTVVILVATKPSRGLAAESIPLAILYQDDDIVVIDKQAGLVVHPAPGNREHTLVNALLGCVDRLSDVNPERPGIVHRLDKETSGVMVAAKTNAAHLDLARQFASHSIERIYVALVRGRVDFDENIIEIPIGRHPYKRKRMAVGFDSATRCARTHYRTLERSPKMSLLELRPFTGRTHQLRVHLAHLGHPVMGDTTYGKDNGFSRMALHARYLGFIHPATGERVSFESPVPPEFAAAMRAARAAA